MDSADREAVETGPGVRQLDKPDLDLDPLDGRLVKDSKVCTYEHSANNADTENGPYGFDSFVYGLDNDQQSRAMNGDIEILRMIGNGGISNQYNEDITNYYGGQSVNDFNPTISANGGLFHAPKGYRSFRSRGKPWWKRPKLTSYQASYKGRATVAMRSFTLKPENTRASVREADRTGEKHYTVFRHVILG